MPEQKNSKFISVIIITVIFGSISGIVADLTARAYFPTLFTSGYSGEMNLINGNYRGSNLVITDAKKVVVEQNDKAEEVIRSSRSSLVGIFKKNVIPAKDKSSDQIKTFPFENYYRIGEQAAQGFVVTSDGWILTNYKIDNAKDYAVTTSDGTVYGIDNIIADSLTSFYFIHVQASDLQVKKFAEEQTVNNGSLIIAANWEGKFFLSSIADNRELMGGKIKSSDVFYDKIIPKDKLNALVVFDLGGDVIGFVDKSGNIEPGSHVASALESLLKNKSVQRAALGINYVDLSLLIPTSGNDKIAKGIVVSKDEKGIAVMPQSAASSAGLKEGDIILSANGIELSREIDISDIVHSFHPGETIVLAGLRKGEKLEVNVKLGELK